MKCGNLMIRNPAACLATDSAARAAQVMKNEDVGSIPVVSGEAEGQLIGIVTDRDLALKVVAEGRDPNAVRVGEIMSRDLVVCRPEDDVEHALRCMSEHQVRRIPIVDQAGKLAGIISQADTARKLDEEEAGEVLSEISAPAGTKRRRISGNAAGRSQAAFLIAGVSAGVAAMYLLDPASGRNRRSLLRDKAAGWLSEAGCAAMKAQRDASNRLRGIVTERRGRLKNDLVPDEKLVNRIRSKMGREVFHPHSIQVSASGGHVILRGPIPESEADRLISCVANTPGVASVDNQMDVEESAARTPGLQADGVRAGAHMNFLQKNWAPATRVAASAIGGGLVLYGLTAPKRWKKATAAVGIGLLTRGITNARGIEAA